MVISKKCGERSQIQVGYFIQIYCYLHCKKCVLQISSQQQLFPDLIKLIEGSMIAGGGSLCSLEY